MPVRRLTGSYSISSAMTKLVNSPAVSACALDLDARVGEQATMVMAPKNSISGEESACCAT